MDNNYSLRTSAVSGVNILTVPTVKSVGEVTERKQEQPASASTVSLSDKATDPNSKAAEAVEQYEAMAHEYGRKLDSADASSSDALGGTHNLDDLEPLTLFTESDVKAFEKTLSNKFAAAGVDTSIPIDLGFDLQGNVIVKNDHPDKEKIESVFKEDSDLRNGMVQTSNYYLFKELYRLNQEWAQKIDNGLSDEAAGIWLVDSAQKAVSKVSQGITFHEGKTADPFGSNGGQLTSSMKQAYGV